METSREIVRAISRSKSARSSPSSILCLSKNVNCLYGCAMAFLPFFCGLQVWQSATMGEGRPFVQSCRMLKPEGFHVRHWTYEGLQDQAQLLQQVLLVAVSIAARIKIYVQEMGCGSLLASVWFSAGFGVCCI